MEAHESQSKGDSKLNKVLQNLRTLQDEKGSLEAKIGQKSLALQAQVYMLEYFICNHLTNVLCRLRLYKRKHKKDKKCGTKLYHLSFLLAAAMKKRHNFR